MNEKFELEVLTRLAVIENKIDDYKNIRQKSSDAYNLAKKNNEAIKEINDRNKWIIKTTLGSLITGLIGIITLILKVGIGL